MLSRWNWLTRYIYVLDESCVAWIGYVGSSDATVLFSCAPAWNQFVVATAMYFGEKHAAFAIVALQINS